MRARPLPAHDSLRLPLPRAVRRGVPLVALLLAACGDGGGSAEQPEAVTLPRHETTLAGYIAGAKAAMKDEAQNGYRSPKRAEIEAWRQAVADLASGRPQVAERGLRAELPVYRVAAVHTPEGRTYLALEPRDPANHPGWGRLLARPWAGRPLILEVPHPRLDLSTPAEGAKLLKQTDARFLLLAGAHRCANSSPSGCDGETTVCEGAMTPYPVSDMAHNTGTPFDIAHRTLQEAHPERIAVSLHGNGRTSTCGDLFLSAGVAGKSTALVRAIANAVPASTGLEVATEGPGATCPLAGTTNVQGRWSNGAAKPCTGEAGQPSGRFLHVEQSLELREDHASVLAEALREAVPPDYNRLGRRPKEGKGGPVPAPSQGKSKTGK